MGGGFTGTPQPLLQWDMPSHQLTWNLTFGVSYLGPSPSIGTISERHVPRQKGGRVLTVVRSYPAGPKKTPFWTLFLAPHTSKSGAQDTPFWAILVDGSITWTEGGSR